MKPIAAALLAAIGLAIPHAWAADSVFVPDVADLSGAGAVSGGNWRDGATLAAEEINAQGGILGRKIDLRHYDTQSNPGVARAQMQKVLDDSPYVVLGPIFSGNVKVTMALAQQAEIPQIMGGEAADLTTLGDPYLFRTSFGQQTSIPKIAAYIADTAKAKKVAVVWVNNDFGKGARDTFLKEMKARNVSVAADIAVEQGQTDFAADVVKAKQSGADAIFVGTNEEEAARFLREAKTQGVKTPVFGDTVLVSQKVIELAGDAAEGAQGHVGLTAEAPIPSVQQYADKFQKRFGYKSDHNGIKGYTAVYLIKYVTEKMGKFDSKAFAETLHGMSLSADKNPGMLMDVTFDANGDIDRQSFLIVVEGGKQKIFAILPKLHG